MRDLDTLPNIYFEKIQQVCIRGTPDIMGHINGYFFALELKKDEKAKADELQKYKLKKASDRGGIALVVYPKIWAKVFNKLKELSKGVCNAKN